MEHYRCLLARLVDGGRPRLSILKRGINGIEYHLVEMFGEEGVSAVNLIQGNIDLDILLRQRNILIHLRLTSTLQGSYLQCIIEIRYLAQSIQKSVQPRFILVDKRRQMNHVRLLCITRFIRQILQHLCNQSQCPSRQLLGTFINQHVRLRCHNRRINIPQKEKPSNLSTYRQLCRIRVLSSC